MQPLAYSPSDAAKVLGISKSRLYELMGEKRIRAKKEGSRTLVLASSIAAYLDSLPDADITTGQNQTAPEPDYAGADWPDDPPPRWMNSFSARLRNALSAQGISKPADLKRFSRREFLRRPNVGRVSMQELDTFIVDNFDTDLFGPEPMDQKRAARLAEADRVRRGRQMDALSLFDLGLSYAEIGQGLGIGESRARQLVDRGRKLSRESRNP